ncbi:MAG: CoA transferase [Acidimicrobiia bacterium]|nr:CoA transferase [Acidimicrobiia bacterium]
MLQGVRVVDRTTQIAGPYCTKLLADAGADVVSVAPGDDSGLYEYLHASKRVAQDADNDLVTAADIVVIDEPIDRAELDAVWAENPALVVVTITPFGCDGPWAGRPATEFTLQAACGSTATRGLPENPPLAAGGRLGEWLAGTYAAVGATAAARSARKSGRGEHVDVAMLDCMTVAMTTFQPLFNSFMGSPPMKGTGRAIEVPSIEPTADDYVVFTTNSAQQFESLLLMMGRPDLVEDKALSRPMVRFKRREEFSAAVHAFTRSRTSVEVLEEAATWRIPAGPVLNGEKVPEFEQFVARGVYGPGPTGRFRQPRPPYQIGGVEPRPCKAAAAASDLGWDRREGVTPGDWQLPLSGVRILDCTAWWAGPAASHILACLGADVIKVEAARRPDLMRFTSTKRPSDGPWWEWGPLFHGVNVGKRAITLDLTRAEGVDLFERLLREADAVLENYTPRVMDQFGLGWDRVHQVNPRAVMVRMPAFGLDGPWGERTGFAQTMECIAGMAWVTGFPDGPPVLVRGACDPLAGAHAAFATMLALDERDRRGEGMLVEAAMVEAAANVAAEQVIEFDMNGVLLTRTGNRSAIAAPQGVYQCEGEDRWVALSVASDDQWHALVAALGEPPWATDVALDSLEGRRAAHDRIDDELSAWCATRDPDKIAALLSGAGVPAEAVMPAIDAVGNPQLRHRRLYEDEDHPVTGRHPIAGLPFRFSHVDRWARRPSPTIGQHNDEVLGEVAPPEELDELRASGVIGEGLAGGD